MSLIIIFNINMNNFYHNWQNTTKLEKMGISVLKLAKKIILQNIPKEEILAIYVKGSFIRREMNEKSDVDIVTILKTTKYFNKLKELDEWGKNSGYVPYPQFVVYSINELKTGKRISKKSNSAAPSRIVKHLKEYKLIYGDDLSKMNLCTRSDKKDFEALSKVFVKSWIPNYKIGKFNFNMLVKQTFWLVENEQRALGNKPPHAWEDLKNSIKNNDHVIYDAWNIRNNSNGYSSRSRSVRSKFVSKLEKYLTSYK